LYRRRRINHERSTGMSTTAPLRCRDCDEGVLSCPERMISPQAGYGFLNSPSLAILVSLKCSLARDVGLLNDARTPLRTFSVSRWTALLVLNTRPVITEVNMKISTRFLELLRMIGRLWTDLPLLFRLLKAWKDGNYRGLSVGTLASLVAALIYVLSPVDLIPDFIPGIGLIDDAAVLAFLLHSMAQDLSAFRRWEESHGKM
jgi:uncharacterized membrane protein YkvA (DUF1232 family)